MEGLGRGVRFLFSVSFPLRAVREEAPFRPPLYAPPLASAGLGSWGVGGGCHQAPMRHLWASPNMCPWRLIRSRALVLLPAFLCQEGIEDRRGGCVGGGWPRAGRGAGRTESEWGGCFFFFFFCSRGGDLEERQLFSLLGTALKIAMYKKRYFPGREIHDKNEVSMKG